jgi:ribokinase
MDLVVTAKRAPEAGETLPGDSFQTIPGGKGANQAAAIGKLGGQVSMAGRTGADDFGKRLIRNLQEQRVNTDLVVKDDQAPTGIALITVEESGENRIIIVAGANGMVGTRDVEQLAGQFNEAGLLIMQLEIPLDTVKLALDKANKAGVPVLLNPAPAYPIPEDWLYRIHYLVLNESEAKAISGMQITSIDTAKDAGMQLQKKGIQVVILTLGAQGAVVTTSEGCWHIPAFKVKVVDTTAAGDAFIGGFAVSILSQPDLIRAVQFGNATGALAATKVGAQSSLPSRDEVEHLLALQGEKTD